MNKKIKTKWVKALESGRYKQTTGKLKSIHGSFCCLGVLCDIYAKEKGLRWKKEKNKMGLDETVDLLPFPVIEWSGLDENDPRVDGEVLTHWNDTKGCSFKEIAKLIKKEL